MMRPLPSHRIHPLPFSHFVFMISISNPSGWDGAMAYLDSPGMEDGGPMATQGFAAPSLPYRNFPRAFQALVVYLPIVSSVIQ